MSLILLHRLKFPPIKAANILFIIFTVLLCSLQPSVSTTEVVAGWADGKTTALNYDDLSSAAATTSTITIQQKPVELSSGFSINSNLLNRHSRVLRNEESMYRNENVRWRKMATRDMDRTRNKRGAVGGRIATSSTKIINFSHKNIVNISESLFSSVKTNFSDILVLNLSNNKINVLNFTQLMQKFSNLEKLDLSENLISYFVSSVSPANTYVKSELNKLIFLNLSTNNLNSFESNERLNNLKLLDLSANQLTNTNRLNFSYLSDLESVDLSCNQLTHLDRTLFANTKSLKIINLSCNWLVTILKQYFFNLINIERLVLSNNNISDIEIDSFAYLPNLQYLDLSHNDIDVSSIRALQGMADLVGLSVANNQRLGNALQGFVASWSLKELDASGTGLCQIPAALAQSVHTLNVANNHFQMIRCGDLDSYPLLQYLDLSSNHIVEIEDDALGRLEILLTLKLQNNNLTSLPTSLPSSLMYLYLTNNQITDVQPQTIQQLINLEVLDLSLNRLIYLPGLPLPKLWRLNLQNSGLRGLSQSVVVMSPNLKDLQLEHNPIKCSELLGIAEWATPCRSDDKILFDFSDMETQNVSVLDMLSERNNYKCRKRYNVNYDTKKCKAEKLPSITPSTTTTTVNDISTNNKLFSRHYNQIDLNKTASQSTAATTTTEIHKLNLTMSKTKSIDEEMQINDITLMGNNDADDGQMKNEKKIINLNKNKENIVGDDDDDEKNRHRTTDTANVIIVPNGKKMNSQTILQQQQLDNNNDANNYLLAAATTTTTKRQTLNETTKNLSRISSDEKHNNGKLTTTKRWKNITKINNKKMLPILLQQQQQQQHQYYSLTNNKTFEKSIKMEKQNDLHKTINQTPSSSSFSSSNHPLEQLSQQNNNNKNEKLTSLEIVENEFNLKNPTTNGRHENIVDFIKSKDNLTLSEEKNNGKLNENDFSQMKMPTRDNFRNNPKQQQQQQRIRNKTKLGKLKQLQKQQIDEGHPKLYPPQHANDKLNPDTFDIYLNDEANPPQQQQPQHPPQEIRKTKNSFTKNKQNDDKLANLPDSLAQMMTRQKDNNLLTQTGQPIFVSTKQNVMVVDVPSSLNKQQQLKSNKKEIINWNTNNPISHQDNESTNKRQQKVLENVVLENNDDDNMNRNENEQKPLTNKSIPPNISINGIAARKDQLNEEKSASTPPSLSTEISFNKMVVNEKLKNIQFLMKENDNKTTTNDNAAAAFGNLNKTKDAMENEKTTAENINNTDSKCVGNEKKCENVSVGKKTKLNKSKLIKNNYEDEEETITIVFTESTSPPPPPQNDDKRINHFNVNEAKMTEAVMQSSVANSNVNVDEHPHESNTSGSPEQWNDVRNATSHPGLFIVIGVTIGMIVTLGLIHLYRCRNPWSRRNYSGDHDPEQYTPAHRDLLPMEILHPSTIQYTDAPIELW